MTVIASRLRGLVAEDGITLTNAFGCYRLDLPEGTWVDLFVAASGARDAEEALAAGKLDQARAAAESAESLARRRSCRVKTERGSCRSDATSPRSASAR